MNAHFIHWSLCHAVTTKIGGIVCCVLINPASKSITYHSHRI
ncbi:Hypothetical protein TRBSAP_021 [Escherichia phage vB_Eco_SAP]